MRTEDTSSARLFRNLRLFGIVAGAALVALVISGPKIRRCRPSPSPCRAPASSVQIWFCLAGWKPIHALQFLRASAVI